jgi:hypothetical protein
MFNTYYVFYDEYMEDRINPYHQFIDLSPVSTDFGLGLGLWCLCATFNNISVILWWSILLVEETGVPGATHRPAASHWQTSSHNIVSSTSHHEQDSITHTMMILVILSIILIVC